ncbi:DUF167 domain-containing protein [Candidatus Peregrinibacteria bacterium]|jgi:uncharacterized protein|nr:DUF167 domain-containing protein [Candidatus Peregrinibacteria bacterium]
MPVELPKQDYLRVKVVPKSSKNEIAEIFTDEEGEKTIKIKIKAVPEKGKANAELIKFLSKETGVSKSQITILNGHTSALKLIKINWT